MLYLFRCNVHGNIDIIQDMNDAHEANCPTCGNKMRRIYTPHYIPTHPTRGRTRPELFDNMAQDGFMSKEWRATDSYYKTAMGITD